MDVSLQHLSRLLHAAAAKANASLDYAGFGHLSTCINEEVSTHDGLEISQRYLAERIWARLQRAEENEVECIRLNSAYVHLITRYLGYASLEEFLLSRANHIPPQLKSCVGNWYSYVRDSSGADWLLRSPVRIFLDEEQEVVMELQGRDRLFRGNLQLRFGGLFVLLVDEDEEKEMHEVYRIGVRRSPEVLVGVFSGFSSLQEAVAGRKVLVRQAGTFDELTIGKLDVSEEVEPEPEWPAEVIDYLKAYNGNYIRISDAQEIVRLGS